MLPEAAARRIRLTLQYDGTGFRGWQRQPGCRTVQSELESVLARLLESTARTAAAGRTDRGVHATGQVVSLDVPAKWSAVELARALNALLPADIRVADAVAAEPDFHARFSAVARSYSYRIGTTGTALSPFRRRWCWPLARPLPEAVLDEAAQHFVGGHSFAAFAKAGQPERGDECMVHRSEWRVPNRHGIVYVVVANRFLHHMVRYMVGTMVDAALGVRPAGDIVALLAGAPGLVMSRPAPPEGLFLTRVYYPGDSLDEDVTDETVP
jgi:tRNA pseudouridine38-40 synthase